MSAVLSSPTPSFPSSSIPIHTPTDDGQQEPNTQAFVLHSPPRGNGGVPPLEASSSSPSASASGSEPSTPTTHAHSGVVPMYPYNVAMIPQNVSGGPMPDDSGITTRLPSICVDYLSHDWAEDDVWTSWKAMTKHKSEIANGVRLENASWRTWAKQRGNLKTISPETLNWLKDSDVTWLYGPLHTNIDAVPPPKESTMSDRLGLEPLRSLSDSKKVAAANAKKNKTKKPEIKTKPILKYRSLSDILMPSTGTSPVTEEELNFDDQSTISVHHARSDSHLVRLNSLNKGRKKRGSPITSPRGTSPERAGQSDSSSASIPVKKEHRHISFNHRVEQCIAVDSTEEARRYNHTGRPSADSDDDDEGSDDEQVLTFKSSPRVASFGPSALSNSSNEWEPHTIARLGPTTLKSVEIYPAPSPVVVYQNYASGMRDVTGGQDGVYGQPTATYSARPGSENTAAQSTGKRPPYDLGAVGASMRQSGWDPEDDDDYAMGFDYFNGPEVGVGDEYDTAQYGSTHLVGGTHNDFQSGGASYLGPGSSSYSANYGVINSNDSTPNHSRRSSNNSSTSASSPTGCGSPNTTSVASASVRGPHAPTASRDAAPPKRSALKGAAAATAPSGRSRESSVESNLSSSSAASTSPRFGTSPANGSSIHLDSSSSFPLHSPSLSSHSSSPSASPHSSANSLASVMATAIPPHVRPGLGRRGSDDGVREARGRSASRGSSSSLERAASADRRSSSSISPSSSYSPPSPALNSSPGGGVAGTKPVQIQSSRKVGSQESLGSAAHAIAASSSPSVTIVPEASSESETETVRDDEGGEQQGSAAVNGVVGRSVRLGGGAEVEEVEDVSIPATVSDTDDSAPNSAATTPKAEKKDSLFPAPTPVTPASAPTTPSSVTKSRPAAVNVPTESIPAGPVSPPLVPAPTSSSSPSHPSRTPGAPRFRQPSPSHTTTSTSAENPPVTVEGATPSVASLSNSPQLDPADIASPQWADESAPSYARRSLLRAARGGSHTSTSSAGSNALAKTNSVDSHASVGSAGGVGAGAAGRASHESGRGSNDPDYGFGYYDEDGQQDGVVSGTVKMAGTAARDMFGALSKSLWGFKRS
ncbi:hypothetical protein BCR35DRAFT_297938 [Leucosporidium creatinivorum]|uniref:Nitrogen regulatory protein areA GATA-like domain-containing protein n=1 Tax=Leucosporidium creatinivorum TaxID=106004 RepID=A0A1Y2G604_9BASI|nr:hypothetical protein BCR35DRAFT_297938 [Leucosporidium creatinivorum]